MNILGNVLGAIAPSVIEWGVKKINNSRIGSSIGNKMRNVKKIVRSDLVQKVYDELSQNPKFVDKHMDHHP
jgi:3-oxoacyl-(acyl-carrier-protein) synthase